MTKAPVLERRTERGKGGPTVDRDDVEARDGRVGRPSLDDETITHVAPGNRDGE